MQAAPPSREHQGGKWADNQGLLDFFRPEEGSGKYQSAAAPANPPGATSNSNSGGNAPLPTGPPSSSSSDTVLLDMAQQIDPVGSSDAVLFSADGEHIPHFL